MRIESIVKRSAGIALSGAMLGMVSSASAGVVTWMDSFTVGGSTESSYANGDLYHGTADVAFAEFSSTGAASRSAYSIGGFGVTLFTTGLVNDASVGIGGSAAGGNDVIQASVYLFQFFSVSGGSVSASLNFAVSDSEYAAAWLTKYNPAGEPGEVWDIIAGFEDNAGGAQSFAWAGDLTDGIYGVYMLVQAGDFAVASGTWGSFAVPAPGAAALLSAAGLIVGRRRKA